MKIRSIILTLFALIATGVGAQTPPTAKTIMDNMRSTEGRTSTQTRIQMQLMPPGGAVSERIIDQFSIKENGLSRMMIVFQKPSSIQNTRFLTIENSNGEEDRWIFLPKAGRSRRIASGQGGESFMESDFSYDDLSMATRDNSGDNFKLLNTLKVGNETHYVVESLPGAGSTSSYSKAIFTVLAEKWIPLKIELFDKNGSLLKVNETLEYKLVDGYWTPMKLTMTNVQSGHSTALTMLQMVYNKPIPAGVFTTRFLETGRP